MAKITLSTITSAFSAITSLNANFAAIATAIENTLSRDGTSPNAMGADLDMDSNFILNLPTPTNAAHAATKAYVDAEVADITGPQGPTGPAGADGADGADGAGVAAGGTTGQVLAKASNTDFDTEWVNAGATPLFTGGEATVSPATGDLVALKDVSDSNNPKFATVSDIVALASGGGGESFGMYPGGFETSVTTSNFATSGNLYELTANVTVTGVQCMMDGQTSATYVARVYSVDNTSTLGTIVSLLGTSTSISTTDTEPQHYRFTFATPFDLDSGDTVLVAISRTDGTGTSPTGLGWGRGAGGGGPVILSSFTGQYYNAINPAAAATPSGTLVASRQYFCSLQGYLR